MKNSRFLILAVAFGFSGACFANVKATVRMIYSAPSESIEVVAKKQEVSFLKNVPNFAKAQLPAVAQIFYYNISGVENKSLCKVKSVEVEPQVHHSFIACEVHGIIAGADKYSLPLHYLDIRKNKNNSTVATIKSEVKQTPLAPFPINSTTIIQEMPKERSDGLPLDLGI